MLKGTPLLPKGTPNGRCNPFKQTAPLSQLTPSSQLTATTRGSSGFTLIEILVAMLIVALGFFGALAMQALNIHQTNSSYYRSQATFLATNIIERMRLNPVAVEAGQYDSFTTQNPPSSTNDCTGFCTATDLAILDLKEWATLFNPNAGHLKPALPAATGSIQKLASGAHRIVIGWQETDRTTGTPSLLGINNRSITMDTDISLL